MNVKDIVRKHNKSCNNAKIFAQRIYDDLKRVNYTDEDLIIVYSEMYHLSLSTYELECLTNKRLISSSDGWKLERVNHINENLNPFDTILGNAIRCMEGSTHNDSVEDEFKRLLKSNGVTKCYISSGFDFTEKYPNGTILINIDDVNLIMSIYKLFTEDPDGIVGDDQHLSVYADSFEELKPNYII